MSLAELPNTITHHPNITSSIRLTLPEGHSDRYREVFIAGHQVQGVLQISTAFESKLSLGNIEVELVAREGRVFWAKKVIFQGPGLPPSNAVLPERSESLPKGHYPARKGTASFPIHIPLPAELPVSFLCPAASISYSLIASIELAFGREKRVLRTIRPLEVISHPASFRHEALMEAIGRGELNITGQTGGRILLEINNGNRRAWGLEGQATWVHARVTNLTAFECQAVSAKLIRRVKVDFGTKEPKIFETVEVDENLARKGHCAPPFGQGVFSINLALPGDQRSVVPSLAGISIHVTYSLQVSVQTISVPHHEVAASIPIEIYHPASLPPELCMGSQSLASEFRAKAEVGNHARIGSLRRWSTPAEIVSAYLNPRVSLPTPPVPVSGLPRRSSFVESPSYSQPDWVVHLPPVMEETPETKAERTSRHLRETSEQRGRSVSPPPLQVRETPRLCRPPSAVGGPRPAPLRSFNNLRPPHSPATPSATPTAQADTPPLLSPTPMSIEPNSYFDQQVHSISISPETPLDLSRLSYATVVSLENFAENLDPPGSDDASKSDLDKSAVKGLKGGFSSPVRDRRSVMSVFEVNKQVSSGLGRPEAKRRESNERRVEVETRHRREESHAAQVEMLDGTDTRRTPDQAVPLSATPGQGTAAGLSQILVTPAHLRSPSSSVRGRGGQVAAAKEIFAALQRATTSPTSAEKKIRRKSVPPAYPAVSPISPVCPAPSVQKKRHSMAVVPSSTSQPVSQAMIPVARSIYRAPSPIKRNSFGVPPIPPLQWNGGRPAKNAFERADVKEGRRKRGAVGKLKALIERFDRR